MKNGFITIHAKTPVDNLIKGHPFGNLWKCHKFQVANIKPHYTKSISNQAKKQLLDINWKTSGLSYGNFISDYIIYHKGEYYLRLQPIKTLDLFYHDSTDTKAYLPSKVKKWLKQRKIPAKQAKAGFKKEIKVRNYNIKHILKIDNQPFELENFIN